MPDTIFVHGLVLHAHHGVSEDERRVGQQFLIDLTLELDLAAAGKSDKLAHTVSYAEVAELTGNTFCGSRFRLIEAAASAVADAILERFPRITKLTITVHKPRAPVRAVFSDLGVTLTRSR